MNLKPQTSPIIERLDAPISVALAYRHHAREFHIVLVVYDGREYPIKRITHRHKEWRGKTLLHMFYLEGEGTHLQVTFDTDTLHWSLLEIRFHAYPTALQPETQHALTH